MNLENYALNIFEEIKSLPEEERIYWYRSVSENEMSVEDRQTVVNLIEEKCAALNLYFNWEPVTSENFYFFAREIEEENSDSDSDSDSDNSESSEDFSNPTLKESEQVWIPLRNQYGYYIVKMEEGEEN